MKKSLFVILLACVSAPGWAQIQRTAVFDFSQPLSLTPSITPPEGNSIIRKTKCYRFTKRNVPKRKTKRLRYRCPPEPYSNSVRTDFFSYSNAIILENQQINTSI